MPQLLVGVLRYPIQYYPFYIRTATLVASPASFIYLDMLFPNASGLYNQVQTTNFVVTVGYAFALETFANMPAGQTVVQVAMPGSHMAFIADNTLLPGCIVKMVWNGTTQNVTLAAASDIGSGFVIGRYIAEFVDDENLRITATNDVIIVLTGVL